TEQARIEELHVAAIEDRAEAMLGLGGHRELVGELAALATAHPLRERTRALLMMALFRDGRQADALAVYTQTRTLLVRELGIDPGQQLQQLHQRILAADPELAAPGGRASAGPARVPVPRELPTDVHAFTGRDQELAELDWLLTTAGPARDVGGGSAVVISAVAGTAGVGKTALAIRWAHRVRDSFPDGQLYINLRGYDPNQPVTAGDALARFLHALGVPGRDIPLEPEDRAARYRSLLDGRRMLVLLDNAESAEQVRPLLPGSPGCAVVVTSRSSLAGLVARDGAHRLDLDLLPIQDSVALLRALIGRRADDDPSAAAALASLCARLPLALRVAAELAVARPATSLAELVGELADQQQRLDLLAAGGDPRTAVRAVFSWSVRHLPVDAARAFALLGLHPGPDLDACAAAALIGTTVERAEQLLGELARAHLIMSSGPGRYSMHDLLRAYAASLTVGRGREDEQRAVLTRLFDYYLAAAASAMDTFSPAEQYRRPRIPRPDTPLPSLAGPDAARAWLDAEGASLVAVARHTSAHGWPTHTVRLAATVYRYFDDGGYLSEGLIIQTHALEAARLTNDRAAQAHALNSLCSVYAKQGLYQQTAAHLRQALALARETGDRLGQARALGNLGVTYFLQGDYTPAAGHHEQAIALYREMGDRLGEARSLDNLGLVILRLGRYEQAMGHHEQALALYREMGDRFSEPYALANLGQACQRRGHLQQAISHLQQAIALARVTGDKEIEANVLNYLGVTCQRMGELEQAVAYNYQAVALFREVGDPGGEAEALNSTGETLLADGDPGQARACHAAALSLASSSGHRYEQARAHNGLAHTLYATGEACQAHRHWREALSLYTDLGTPEADEVQAHLTELSTREGQLS
ncbi:MAG TPA: tetratricopeptide repeat protein, partial [Streptosporangiaceae bacterium]|nr:tetratricopeptide repeat protein [Streptosporangiaceae bacterium]